MIQQKRIFFEELQRAFSWKRFALIFTLSTAVFAVGYLAIDWIPPERSYIDLWYALYNQSFFIQLLPLIGAFPFADSLVIDRTQGYLYQLLARCPYRKVIRAKMVANALAGGVSTTLPLVLLYVVTNLLLPRTQHPLNHPLIDQFAVRPYNGLLRPIYLHSPDTFALILIGLVFIVGAAYTTFGLSLSFWTNNRFLALGLPYVFFTFTQYFTERTRLLDWFWSPVSTLQTYPKGHLIQQINDIPLLFFNPLVVLAISSGLVLLFSRREQVLETQSLWNSVLEKIQSSLILPIFCQHSLPGINMSLSKAGLDAGKPWRNYLFLQMRMILLRGRWLLVVPVMAVMTVILSKFLLINRVSQFADAREIIAPVNVWDAFFVIFGNPYSMSLVIANLFLILVSDFQPETGYGQLALFRLRSRFQSWAAKTITLFSLAGLYVLVSSATIIVVAAFWFPIDMDWSRLALSYGEGINLPALLPRTMALFDIVGIVLSLVALGLACLGLLVMLINSLTQQRLVGYLFVEALLLSSLGISSMLVNGPDWQMVLPVIRNLVLVMVPFLERRYPLWMSFASWLVWLAIILPIGVLIVRRQDYPANPAS